MVSTPQSTSPKSPIQAKSPFSFSLRKRSSSITTNAVNKICVAGRSGRRLTSIVLGFSAGSFVHGCRHPLDGEDPLECQIDGWFNSTQKRLGIKSQKKDTTTP